MDLQTGVVGLEVTHQVLRQAEVDHCNTANTADKCRADHCDLLTHFDHTVKSANKEQGFKEPPYKECPVIRNKFSLPNL